MLLGDERFARQMDRLSAGREGRMMTTSQAANKLGVSEWTIRNIAPMIGGVKKGTGKRDKWMFEESGLKERYKEYLKMTI